VQKRGGACLFSRRGKEGGTGDEPANRGIQGERFILLRRGASLSSYEKEESSIELSRGKEGGGGGGQTTGKEVLPKRLMKLKRTTTLMSIKDRDEKSDSKGWFAQGREGSKDPGGGERSSLFEKDLLSY